MNLIEHKYIPNKLDDVILNNKHEILKNIHNYINNNTLNLLLIGSFNTLKNVLIELIVKEYSYTILHIVVDNDLYT